MWLNMHVDGLSSLLTSELGSRQCLLVALDGPGGAGKSTLARALAEQSTFISIVQIDDFYAPMVESERETLTAEQGYEKYFDWVRMQEQLLVADASVGLSA